MLESISLAFQNVWRHKLRSFLTMLGIIIGIASIITIVSTIKGTNEQIKESLVRRGLKAASQRSYALFLIHYPVSLVAGVLFANWAADRGPSAVGGSTVSVAAVVGLVLTWLTCLLASDLLYRFVERAGSARRPGLAPA